MDSKYGSSLAPLLEESRGDDETMEALAAECSSDLQEKRLDIVHLLDVDLREAMVNTKVNFRLKALTFLSRVLANFVNQESHPFDTSQLHLLVTFYIDRFGYLSKFRVLAQS